MQPSTSERLANAIGGAATVFGQGMFEHAMQKERLESYERQAGMRSREYSAAQRRLDYNEGIVPQENITRMLPDTEVAIDRMERAAERGRGSVIRGQVRTDLPPVGLRSGDPLEGALFGDVDLRPTMAPKTFSKYPVGSVEHIQVPGGSIPVPVEEAPPDPVTGAPRVRLFSRSAEGRDLAVKSKLFEQQQASKVASEYQMFRRVNEAYPDFGRDMGAFDAEVAKQGGYSDIWGKLVSGEITERGAINREARERGEEERKKLESEAVAEFLSPYMLEGKSAEEVYNEIQQYKRDYPAAWMRMPTSVKRITLDDIEQFRRRSTPQRFDFLQYLFGMGGSAPTLGGGSPTNPLGFNNRNVEDARKKGIETEESVLNDFSPDDRLAALEEVGVFVDRIATSSGRTEPTVNDLVAAMERVSNDMSDDNPNKQLYLATMARMLRYYIEQAEANDPSMMDVALKTPIAIGDAIAHLFR